jgi:hypothetical protein
MLNYPPKSFPASPARVVSGQYLAKNHLYKRDRAKLAADIIARKVVMADFTVKQIAALVRVSVPYIAEARNGHKRPSLAEHLVSSTPAERLEAAKALGVDVVWDSMVLPLVGTAAAAE